MHNRIKLIKGKQKELIILAKNKSGMTWREFSNNIDCSYGYLTHELIIEKRTLSKKLYYLLCKIANINFDEYIECTLNSNWGQIKGAQNIKIRKNLFKKIKLKILCKKSFKLAEIIGIIIGDGSIYILPKKGIYKLDICSNFKNEKQYTFEYVKPLIENVFKIKINSRVSGNALHLYKNSKNLIYTLNFYGIPSGNKMNNNIKIPPWIISNKKYLRACIRGIIDTDGTVYPKNKTNLYPNIWVSSGILTIRESIFKAFKILEINISEWNPKRRDISIRRRYDVKKYFKEVGFSNPKNLLRFNKFMID